MAARMDDRDAKGRGKDLTNVAFTETHHDGAVSGEHAPVQAIGPGTQIGDYDVGPQIGRGSMGDVFGAVHRTIGRKVAIKVMSPKLFLDTDAMHRFVNEARAVAAIHHPGIVDVYGFGTLEDGRAYMIMEWLAGRTLQQRLEEGPLPPEDTLRILLQTASALRAAHAQKIVHRDLKPDNIFLNDVSDEKPIVKLLDFGLAKFATGDQGVSRSSTGQLIGTPLYMSPEQCRNKKVDHRTDIYALGCIAFQLITGRTPFEANNLALLVTAHVENPPPRPSEFVPDVPPPLDLLVHRMLAKDPEARPTLQDVRTTVQALLDTGGNQTHIAEMEEPLAFAEPSPEMSITVPGKKIAMADAESQIEHVHAQVKPPATRSSLWIVLVLVLVLLLVLVFALT